MSGTVTIAIVANPQMRDIQELSDEFHRENPDITVRFVTLPENEARARITQDVATKAGQFDVVMIGTYEAPIWGRNGWLTDLNDYARERPDYDVDDLMPAVRKGLSADGDLYAVPFYGESSFLMYRKDLFERGRADDARAADLDRGRRVRAPAQDAGPGRHLPARAARLGRAARAAQHGHQHVRRPLVRQGVERPAHLAGHREGGRVLHRPDQGRRRAGRARTPASASA